MLLKVDQESFNLNRLKYLLLEMLSTAHHLFAMKPILLQSTNTDCLILMVSLEVSTAAYLITYRYKFAGLP